MEKRQKTALKTKLTRSQEQGESPSMMSLENQLLIAMPTLADPYFQKTVTYICEHNKAGAMGLIINLPVNITVADLLKQIEPVEAAKNDSCDLPDNSDSTETTAVTDSKNSLKQLVLSGGPLAQHRGFVLHSSQTGWNSSLTLSKELMITTSKDILMALGTEKEPEQFMVTLGYASWGPGQLEQELQANSWLTAPADSEILFNTPIEQRWKKATEILGIDLAHLSSDIGHA
ncbi:uncharacterized protein family UPF0301 [Colwellia marinimaniae]|uniref:UPF0301 protein MTCD1_00336 n=2 Tax=Colwelliaceae TaxID=267889 RepID=A0ABQ0MQU7_9GAMM|nr:uncharacterized protein family UPF0301 [Colwellia marinimaniae]